MGSYASDTPDAALAEDGDLFDINYDTDHNWVNPPASAAVPTNDWWTNILASQFAGVPVLASPDAVTRDEEERICAYYGGGYLYATPARAEPLL